MAFIRWKHNGIGGRQAYLVHAYRGPDGKPKQKILAYLGNSSILTPERLASLRERHKDLKINWDKIQPATRPAIDVSSLSDAELLMMIRHLRHAAGMSQSTLAWKLRESGMPPCEGGGYAYSHEFGRLEKALERGEPQE